MQVIAQTGPRGKVVRQNATRLVQALAQGATVMEIEADIFSAEDTVTVGEEDLRIDSHGTSNSVTRARNGTADSDHAAGANARLAPGTELLAHTFAGTDYLSAVRCGGEAEAMFGLEVDGELKYVALSSPYQLEVFFPMARYQPAESASLRVLVWTWTAEAVFWAQLQA